MGLLFTATALTAVTLVDFSWSPSALTGDFNTASNWQGGLVPTSSSTSTTLTFSGWSNAPTTPIVTLASTFETNAITFNGSSVNYQLAGSSGAVLKLGSGGITANGGATISLLNSLPIVLLADQSWQATNATNLIVQSVVSGAFSISKTGNFDLTLGAANTFSGGLTLYSGKLLLGSSSTASGSTVVSGPVGTGTLSIGGNTTLGVTGPTTTLHNALSIGTETVATIDSGSGTLTLSGIITGNGTLTKTGTGTLILEGANIYNDGTVLTAGTLVLGRSSFLDGSTILSGPVGRDYLDLASGTTLSITPGTTRTLHNEVHLGGEGTVTVNTAGGTLNLDGFVHNLTEGAKATLEKTGAGTLTLSNSSNQYSGATTITTGTLALGGNNAIPDTSRVTVAAGSIFNLANFDTRIDGLSGAGTITLGTGKLTLIGEDSSTFSGLITGAGRLTQSGSGNLTLSGANTFTGGLELEDGYLYFGSSSSVTGATITSGPIGTGMLAVNDDNTFGITAGNITLHNKIELSGYYDANVTTGDDYMAASNLTLAGLITGTNGLYKYGYGSLTLTGANTFSGGLTVSTDSLLLGASSTGAVGAVTAGPVGTGTLTLDNDTTLGIATGTGATTLHNSIELSYTYDPQLIDTTNGNLTLLGTISGSGGLNKIGTGSLTLSGANIFTGGTKVTTGTLLLGSSSIVAYLMDPWDITSSPVGTGSLELLGGTTLAPAPGTSLVTLFNPVIISGDITIGLPGSTSQLRIDTKPYLYSGLNASSRSKNVTVAGGVLTLASGPGESYSVENFVVQNGAALIFAFKVALPNALVTANTGSYVGIANGMLSEESKGFDVTSPYSAANLIAKITPATFAGTFGFDSEDPLLPATYAGTLDFTSFTDATFAGLSTASSAILGSGATLFAPTGTGSQALAFSALNGGYLQVDTALLAAHNFTQGIVIGRDDGRADAGTVALTNPTNTYTGGTTLKSGTLVVRDNAALGAGTITAVNATTAPTSQTNAPKLTTTLTGGGALALTLPNNLVVNTSYASGTYGLGIGGVDSFTLSGLISGAGIIDKYGAGTLTLTGNTTAFTGKLNVLAGTLSIGAGGTAGTITGNIVLSSAASLTFNRSDSSTYADVVSGAGTLTKLGDGTLTLTNHSTYSGGTTITAGTLALGNGGTTGGIAGGVLNNGTLAFNRSDSVLFAGLIAGTGVVEQSGSGSLTLTGANTYTGPTHLNAGSLLISTSSTFGGSTITNGPLGRGELRFGGGNLSLINTAPTTILHNAIALGSENTVTIDSGTGTLTLAGVMQGGSFFKTGAGTLTLSGANTYSQTTVNAGTLAVSSDANLGTAPATPTAGSITLAGGILRTTASFTLNANRGIALNASTSSLSVASGTTLTYGGAFSGSEGLTLIGGGTLLLNGATASTYTGGTVITSGALRIQSEFALPATTAVTVANAGIFTAEDSVNIGSLAGSGNVQLKNGKSLTINQATNSTFSGVLSDITSNGSLIKTGAGTLTLSGLNTYSGPTAISGGAITATNSGGSATGSGTVTIDAGGTLNIGNGGNTGIIAGNIVNNGTLQFNRSNSSIHAGVISGSGGLTKLGAGSLILTGANAYTGTTSINNGTLWIGAANTLPTTTTVALAFGAILDVDFNQTIGGFSGSGSGSGVDLNSGTTLTVAFPTANTSTAYGGNIVGGGILALSGSNNVFTMNGVGSHTGGTQVGTGTTLILANGAGFNSLFAVDGTLNLNASIGRTIANPISGTGSLLISAGANTLTAANTYSGGTTINSGSSLTIGNGGTTGSLVGNIANAGTLTVNRSDALTLAGTISGGGGVNKIGGGTLTLAGTNTYTGGTTVQGGGVSISADQNLGVSASPLSLNGAVLKTTAAIPAFTHAINLVSSGGTIDTNGFDSTVSSAVSGNANLTKAGAGTLTLTGQSSYVGNTFVTGGKLELDVVNALPSTTLLSLATGSILDVDANQTVAGFFGASGLGATLDLAAGITFTVAMPVASTTTTFAGAVVGNGIFAVSGAGSNVVNLTGTVANTVTTSVGPGAILIIGSGGTITGPVTTSGILNFTNPGSQTLSGVISGSGGLNIGAGTTTLSGNNTYSGPTDITGGKLILTGSNTGGGTITVGSGGVFAGTGSTTGPLILNPGSAVSPGASPGILNVGATTFAGGAHFAFEINSTSAAPGMGWDLLSISGALTITATPVNPFIIDLTSLNLSNNAALLANFTNTNSYSWQFVATTGGVTGFSAGAFQYNASQFQNSLGAGHFFVSESSGNLFLNFTPVPEPSTYALLALGLGVIVVLSRRRRS